MSKHFMYRYVTWKNRYNLLQIRIRYYSWQQYDPTPGKTLRVAPEAPAISNRQLAVSGAVRRLNEVGFS